MVGGPLCQAATVVAGVTDPPAPAPAPAGAAPATPVAAGAGARGGPPTMPVMSLTRRVPAPTGPLARPLSADGLALGDGPARDALRQALLQLEQAETAARSPALLCDALVDAARALAALHAYSLADSCLARARHWALVMGAVDLQADLASAAAEVAANVADLADARGETASRVREARALARDQALEAARLAGRTTDPHWEIRVLLRASDVLDRCGDHDDAVQLQHRALVLMGLHESEPAADGENRPAEPGYDTLRLAAPGRLM